MNEKEKIDKFIKTIKSSTQIDKLYFCFFILDNIDKDYDNLDCKLKSNPFGEMGHMDEDGQWSFKDICNIIHNNKRYKKNIINLLRAKINDLLKNTYDSFTKEIALILNSCENKIIQDIIFNYFNEKKNIYKFDDAKFIDKILNSLCDNKEIVKEHIDEVKNKKLSSSQRIKIFSACKNKYHSILEEKYRNLPLESKKQAEQYQKISIKCFKYAFAWFVMCWIVPIFFDWLRYVCDWQYNLPKDYSREIFIFLSKLLFKLPSFVLCLVGVKFLYLFVQYKTEERELKMLDDYLGKIPNDCKQERAELVKQLAPHFFPDKKSIKISQGFLQELLFRIIDTTKDNNKRQM